MTTYIRPTIAQALCHIRREKRNGTLAMPPEHVTSRIEALRKMGKAYPKKP